jgi:hypothetical protein
MLPRESISKQVTAVEVRANDLRENELPASEACIRVSPESIREPHTSESPPLNLAAARTDSTDPKVRKSITDAESPTLVK